MKPCIGAKRIFAKHADTFPAGVKESGRFNHVPSLPAWLFVQLLFSIERLS
jgi:hypothetical protein